ncbi:unnamed protein product [Phytomonas sp. Hart1]|nr:unnamed protein product [Phytomonas sp. Hart1]|eukprot:CCW69061.1 unnamed protein product [Phytomonas sp. isolate Hart1]
MFLDTYYSITRKPLDHPLGYMVAISGALMEVMCYGIDNGFSTFSRDMENDPSLGSPSEIRLSYGNSVAVGTSPIFGVFAGLLVDRLPPRLMMLASTLFMFLGLWIGSVANNVEGVIFGYCLMASISCAFMITPSVTTTGTWFRRRLSIAQGLNSCGGGIGNFIIQPVTGYLVQHYGWRRALRYTSFFCLIGVFASIFSCKRAEPNEDSKEAQSDAIVKETGGLVVTHMSNIQAQSGTASQNDLIRKNSSGSMQFNDNPIITDASSNIHEHHTVGRSLVTEVNDADSLPDHNDLMYAVNTRSLSIVELIRVFLTKEFLANFFMYFFFAWTFFGLLWSVFRFYVSMGEKGTPYENATPISYSQAASLFTFWGASQVFSAISTGIIANFTSEPFIYILSCIGCVIMCLITPFFRTYALFAFSMSILGFCTAGIFTMMPCFLVKQFYGPNLGLIISIIFVGGCVGGFFSPVVLAHIHTFFNNYTPCYMFMAFCTMISAILCFSLLSKNKKCGMPFCSM